MNVIVAKLFFLSVSLLIVLNIFSVFHQHIEFEKHEEFVDNFQDFLKTKKLHQAKYAVASNERNIDMRMRQDAKDGMDVETKRSPSFLSEKENKRGSINVYYYMDICADYDNYNVLWNTLFPKFPGQAKLFSNFDDLNAILEGQARRMIGFIHPKHSDWYQFKIESRYGCEFRLIASDGFKRDEIYDSFLLKFGLYKEQMVREDEKDKPYKAFIAQSKEVYLETGVAYLIDFLHVMPVYGFLHLKWRRKGQVEFTKISSQLLSTIYSAPKVTDILPNIVYGGKTISEKSKLISDDRRNLFHQLPTVRADNTEVKHCDYRASYVPESVVPDHGVAYVQVDKLYPPHLLVKHHNKNGYYDLFIDKETVFRVVRKFMEMLGSDYTLRYIVNVEENKETGHKKRYFIEADVSKRESTRISRYSGWLVLNSKTNELCIPNGYHWKGNETIYLITPVKNQARWIRFLVHHLNEIVDVTKEKNIHLVLYDFNSTDDDVRSILSDCRFPYTYHSNHGRFSKVIGLNRAVSAIEVKDPIIFILDLQLQLPLFLFDYIRKHTFRGQTTYVPILLRLCCGEHAEYTKLTSGSIWQEIGYGMISVYKSDWLKIGGMNETRFSQKWGGEDWEFIDRVLMNKLEVIHHRLPGYYHIHHSVKGTWDGTKN